MNPCVAPYIDDPIPRVLGSQYRTFPLDDVTLQGRLAIDSRSNDVLVDSGFLLADNREVTV